MTGDNVCCCWFLTLIFLVATSGLATMTAFSFIATKDVQHIRNSTVNLEPTYGMLVTSFIVYGLGAIAAFIFFIVLVYHASKETIDLVYEEAVSRVQKEMSPSAETVGDDVEVNLEDSVECGCKV